MIIKLRAKPSVFDSLYGTGMYICVCVRIGIYSESVVCLGVSKVQFKKKIVSKVSHGSIWRFFRFLFLNPILDPLLLILPVCHQD